MAMDSSMLWGLGALSAILLLRRRSLVGGGSGAGPGRGVVTERNGVVTETGTPIGTITYRCDPAGRYGGSFGDRKPEGLPDGLPCVSEREAAYPYVEEIARRLGANRIIQQAILSLVDNESSGQFNRPADAFDDPRRRSWGVYQPLGSSWRGMADSPRSYWYPRQQVMPPEVLEHAYDPWGASPYEQIVYSTTRYVLAANNIKRLGGNDVDAARGIRIYHSGSPKLIKYIEGAARLGSFPESYERMAEWTGDSEWVTKIRENDSELRAWGVPV